MILCKLSYGYKNIELLFGNDINTFQRVMIWHIFLTVASIIVCEVVIMNACSDCIKTIRVADKEMSVDMCSMLGTCFCISTGDGVARGDVA